MGENSSLYSQTCCWLRRFYGFIVTLFLILLLFWLLLFPKELKLIVTDASINQFKLYNNTLFYNFVLNITIRNPNKKLGVYFDRFHIITSYRKKSFASVTLNHETPFYQDHKTTTLHPIFQGEKRVIKYKKRDVGKYVSDKRSMVFSIDVKLDVQVRIKHGSVKSGQFKPPRIECNRLKIPVRNSSYKGTSVDTKFKPRMCKNVFILFSPEIDDDVL